MKGRASIPLRAVLAATAMLLAIVPLPIARGSEAASATPASASEAVSRAPLSDRFALLPGALAVEQELQPGVVYRQFRLNQTRTYELDVDPATDAKLDVGIAGRRFPAFLQTSRQIARRGGIAGVNGDFGLFPGRPGHTFIQDGDLLKSSELGMGGKGFSVTEDEQRIWLGGTDLVMQAVFTSLGPVSIDDWNATALPDKGQVAAYTPVGGKLFPPPRDSCGVRLVPAGAWAFAVDGETMQRDYTVDFGACRYNRLPVDGGLVLATRRHTVLGPWLAGLVPGEAVTVSWTLGWKDALDVIGGSPILVHNGESQTIGKCNDAWLCQTHPRTAVGVTADDHVLLVVMDGRSETSGGATLEELSDVMIDLGAVEALNLDGGGSSTMVINGEVVNTPSDGQERAVSSSIVVLPTSA